MPAKTGKTVQKAIRFRNVVCEIIEQKNHPKGVSGWVKDLVDNSLKKELREKLKKESRK